MSHCQNLEYVHHLFATCLKHGPQLQMRHDMTQAPDTPHRVWLQTHNGV